MIDREVLIEKARKASSKIEKTILYWLAGEDKHYKRCNVFALHGTLYSYGTHYQISIRIKDDIYLVNSDRYSPTTSGHCWQAYWAITNNGGVPLRVSMELYWQMYWAGTGDIELIDYKKDESFEKAFHSKEEAEDAIRGLRVMRGWKTNIWRSIKNGWWVAEAYRPQFLLFKKEDDTYWLMGYDEGRQFLVQLPTEAITVEEALKSLAPLEVIEAEEAGIPVYRQGEFFFVKDEKATKVYPKKPTEATERRLGVSMKKRYRLIRGERASSHVATWAIINKDEEVFVRGVVRHPEHRILKLQDGWYKVYENTAIRSFSEGRVVD